MTVFKYFVQMGYIATATAEMGPDMPIITLADPGISNSVTSTVLTSTAFFYYANFHEIWNFFHVYSTLIFSVLAILGYYIWHVDDAALGIPPHDLVFNPSVVVRHGFILVGKVCGLSEGPPQTMVG
ncbi:hypothetical protein PISMIDRAFT_22705 [Pisolithus microcarpus 441]|uniref:Uncharacterized protein n=1 Tax=Pisolithus microcarpus 441 TaxID=765257 RepID=A0A0C9ZIF6_9AGAM|nr:hypothetical protein BKA83DRAFT_22705 [Pisolithus microcarpus]KIK25779.1 hypothetical protein PISMIDRAFT_22705 [Pisolithus microcarpus 441]